MATVYNIEIKTVSSFVNYNEKQMEVLIKSLLDDYKDSNGLGFENTEIKVNRNT